MSAPDSTTEAGKMPETRRVCIVTPDMVGPIKNGGIGTHCLHLARVLAAEPGMQVTVLFTGPFEAEDAAHWRRHYAAEGIAFVALADVPTAPHPLYGAGWHGEVALRVLAYLKAHPFDVVHFQEWQANGFSAIQAKRVGAALADTRLTVTMHSSSEWLREGMQQWGHDPVHVTRLDYAERYCCEHADLLLSPSQAMLDWAIAHGWALAPRRQVAPLCFTPAAPAPEAVPLDATHLIFFGRLETRKGLQIFCEAIRRVVDRHPGHGITRVTFLGKDGTVGTLPGSAYVRAFAADVPDLQVTVQTNLDSAAALAAIQASGGLVVMPSLLDNFPYAVLECIQARVPFLAARVGGIPEFVDPAALFTPTAAGLAEAIAHRTARQAPVSHPYDAATANAAWAAVSSAPAPARTRPTEAPLVSVCVPFYNLGAYLPQLLTGLEASTYANFEVIVVNDGSTDAASNAVFAAERARRDARFHFYDKPNAGLGHTRNYAVARANGALCVFVDADNVPKPEMLGAFVTGMAVSGVDCLTCHFDAFEGDAAPDADTPVAYAYTPIGPCLELGVLENVFGDANFCIRREVFSALGGFTEDRETTFEDWEFLAHLALKGYRQDVVPQALVWYRHLETSFSRSTAFINNHKRALRPYLAACPPALRRIIYDVAVPSHGRGRSAVGAALESATPQTLSDVQVVVNVAREVLRRPAVHRPLLWLLTRSFRLYRGLKGLVRRGGRPA